MPRTAPPCPVLPVRLRLTEWLGALCWISASMFVLGPVSGLAQTALAPPAAGTKQPAAAAHTFGRKERVSIIGQPGFEFIARLDGKAQFSSLTPAQFQVFLPRQ